MILQNEYLPYKQSLQLRELGFNEPCKRWYDGCEKQRQIEVENNIKNNNTIWFTKDDCTAPTFRQAFKWFNDKYGLFYCLDFTYYDSFNFGFKWVAKNGVFGEEWYDASTGLKGWNTPEETELAAIDFFIKKVK